MEKKMIASDNLIWIIFLTLFLGCSSVQVSQDFLNDARFLDLKTYRWKSEKQKPTGDKRLDNPFLVKRIRSAVENSLSAKGYTKLTEGKPDFYVSYGYSLRSKIESRDTGASFGFGFGSVGRYGGVGINTGQEVRQYDQATLIIDFINTGSDDLMWRGTGTSRASEHSTPEKATKAVNEMVTKILDQFPPL